MVDLQPILRALSGIQVEFGKFNKLLEKTLPQVVEVTCEANNRLADLADQGDKLLQVKDLELRSVCLIHAADSINKLFPEKNIHDAWLRWAAQAADLFLDVEKKLETLKDMDLQQLLEMRKECRETLDRKSNSHKLLESVIAERELRKERKK